MFESAFECSSNVDFRLFICQTKAFNPPSVGKLNVPKNLFVESVFMLDLSVVINAAPQVGR